jgi:hypothetical protein
MPSAALDPPAESEGQEQARDGVDRHETAGQDQVITVSLEQHGQDRRQLEHLERRKPGE